MKVTSTMTSQFVNKTCLTVVGLMAAALTAGAALTGCSSAPEQVQPTVPPADSAGAPPRPTPVMPGPPVVKK